MKLLEFIHREVVSVSSFFIDEYSFGYVYLLHRKFDASNKFIEFKVKSDNLLGKHIKALWLDRGGVSSKFGSFQKEHEIIS